MGERERKRASGPMGEMGQQAENEEGRRKRISLSFYFLEFANHFQVEF
jgi:hypothetical protein